MFYQRLSVHCSGSADNSRPKIQFYGDWLTEMGFSGSALVQALPEPGGFCFTLKNNDIESYSSLFDDTKEKGGSLVRVFISNGQNVKGPTFTVSGKYLERCGLKTGDALIAKCEYGLIRVRKVCDGMHVFNIQKRKDRNTGEPIPNVYLHGSWLDDALFTPYTLVTVVSVPGLITLTALDKDTSYQYACRHARQNKMRLLSVSFRRGSSVIDFTGSHVDRAGFSIGELVTAIYEQGVIKLQKFEPERLCF